jgi:hypothetical protein
MFWADLGSEAYGEKTLDIMRCSRMYPTIQKMFPTQYILP